jgi:Leucine-rich repeat (LRR) protein
MKFRSSLLINLYIVFFYLSIVLTLQGCSSSIVPISTNTTAQNVPDEQLIRLEELTRETEDEIWKRFFEQRGADFWDTLNEYKHNAYDSYEISLENLDPPTIADISIEDQLHELVAGVVSYIEYYLPSIKSILFFNNNNEPRYNISLVAEIARLVNLQELTLTHNQLETFPPAIANLTNLKTLDLSGNQISILPSEIANLTNLKALYLSTNQISTLPSEIVNLTNLETLILRENQISAVPFEITNLTNLKTLDLSYNQISTLPSEIANLTNLRELTLTQNIFKFMPDVSLLPRLEIIELGWNNIKMLPSSILLWLKSSSNSFRADHNNLILDETSLVRIDSFNEEKFNQLKEYSAEDLPNVIFFAEVDHQRFPFYIDYNFLHKEHIDNLWDELKNLNPEMNFYMERVPYQSPEESEEDTSSSGSSGSEEESTHSQNSDSGQEDSTSSEDLKTSYNSASEREDP